MPADLTPKQQTVLDYVQSHRARHDVFPSLREIQAHFGFASPFAVTRHLQALEKKGALSRQPGKARAFTLPNHGASLASHDTASLLSIPVFGVIPAGLPTAHTQDYDPDETLSVDPSTLNLPRHTRLFGLRVRDDSMIGANIIEDDIVFLTPGKPRPGQIVAALLDGESTLKRFLTQHDTPFLRAENPCYPDLLPAEKLLIQGIMVGLLRRVPGES
ncbi:MAG: repressor LexA [Candidatus Synoicihabitans palmerolidicus]|nr:repressor LexA [Candidatus Synoicihabitans palmerolidicus]